MERTCVKKSWEKSQCKLTDEVPGYLKILFSEFKILSSLPYSLWGLQHDKHLNNLQSGKTIHAPLRPVIGVPLRRSWTCSFPPPARSPWHQAPSAPAECSRRGIRWRGPLGPRWLWLPPGTLTLTAYLSVIGRCGFRSSRRNKTKTSDGRLRFSLTSRCLDASSLRDISISLVRMLRKCMSLSRVARFTVAPFVDWREKFERELVNRNKRNKLSGVYYRPAQWARGLGRCRRCC